MYLLLYPGYIYIYNVVLGLFVVVSWISFVVPPDVIPGRMALLITLFLVLVNIFNTVTSNTPKAEGKTICKKVGPVKLWKKKTSGRLKI